MTDRNINALIDALKENVHRLCPSTGIQEEEDAVVLIELARQFFLDINRCAQALEAIAFAIESK